MLNILVKIILSITCLLFVVLGGVLLLTLSWDKFYFYKADEMFDYIWNGNKA